MSSSVLTAPPRLPRPIEALEPIEDTTRRQFITGVGAAALAAAFLAACGDDEAGTPAPSATPDRREVIDAAGNAVDVPVRAERIVALSDINVAAQMIELGVMPVGMVLRGGEFYPYLAEGVDFSDVTPVGERREPDLEAIASLSPDLIIATSEHEAFLDQLRAIAPTVIFDAFLPLDDLMRMMADFLGVPTDTLSTLRDELHDRVARIKEQVPYDLATVRLSYIAMQPDGTALNWFYADAGNLEVQVIHMLGVEMTSAERADDQNALLLPVERIREVDADAIFYYAGVVSVAELSNIPENPLWLGLQAVEAGQTYDLGFRVGGPTYAMARRFLDVVEPALLDPEFDPNLL